MHHHQECVLAKSVRTLEHQLAQTGAMLSADSDYTQKKVLKSLEKSVEELKRLSAECLKFRVEYARETVELFKERQINAGGKLQTLSYTTGKDRAIEEKSKATQRKKRKLK